MPKYVIEREMPGAGKLIALRTASGDERVLEAARDVVAHACAVVKRHAPIEKEEPKS